MPQALVATQSYKPASAKVGETMVNVALVAPGILAPFLRHCRDGEVPEKIAISDAGEPRQAA